MATVSLTNTQDAQALRGQDVIVKVSISAASNQMQQISVGDTAIAGASEGFVSRVDYYGNSFHVTPRQPNLSFETPGQPGYFTSGSSVVVTIS